uniref:Ig-like domain-containing protein n=1 Tax=Callorhinchus milii TaxID=7868 RepID=A0A4W3GSQ4_CALMI
SLLSLTFSLTLSHSLSDSLSSEEEIICVISGAWLTRINSFLVPGGDGVVMTSSNQNIEVREFERVLLPCKYDLERPQIARLEWKKIKKSQISFVYYAGGLMKEYQGRAEMSKSNIILQKVTRADAATYRCEVSAKDDSKSFAQSVIVLIVFVPPAVPTCKVPSSGTTGAVVKLSCFESEGWPPSKYTWYKDNLALTDNPARVKASTNTSYKVNRTSGSLVFTTVKKGNSGKYHCLASNGIGQAKNCSAKFMQINDLNVGAIVVSVVIVALVLSLCGLGVCYAHRKGYLGITAENISHSLSESFTYVGLCNAL